MSCLYKPPKVSRSVRQNCHLTVIITDLVTCCGNKTTKTSHTKRAATVINLYKPNSSTTPSDKTFVKFVICPFKFERLDKLSPNHAISRVGN